MDAQDQPRTSTIGMLAELHNKSGGGEGYIKYTGINRNIVRSTDKHIYINAVQ